MKRFFNIDRGAKEAKAANLGDIKSTKIGIPFILSYPLFDPKMAESEKKQTLIKGNVKAIVPIMREKFALEYEEIGTETKEKYTKMVETPLKEKRIFGILTAKQVGYIPNVQVSFTEDEENFSRDTYAFKSVPVSGLI